MSQPALRQPVPVGKYFLDAGKITQLQLDLALQHRASFNLKLGQSLVELGFVTEADMVEALRHQARFPCIHLTGGIVDVKVAAKVGEVVSRRLRAIALNQIAGHTTVALEDPSDAEALGELQHILATRIFPVYAEPSAIQKNLDRVFGHRGAPQANAPSAAPEARRPTPAEPAAPASAPRSPRPAAEPSEPAEAAPDERAVVEKVRAFLHLAFEQGASSIHLETRGSELVVRTRVDGLLREHSRLPAAWARPTIACLKSLAKLENGETDVPQEGSVPFLFKKQHVEVRVATTPSLHGESAVLHVLGRVQERRELAQLGIAPEQLKELESLLATRGGLMLVAGPAASGRSTTAHALLERLTGPERKVVALATHAGRELPGVLQVQVDGDAAAAVRRLQRQDPDVLFVPEAGERECAHALLEVALAGCGVLAVLRAGGALEALLRCLHLGLEPYLLADALRGIVAQRLVRRICNECRTPIVPDEALRARLGLGKDEVTYQEGQGCDACQGTGYRGRMGLFEVLTMTPGLRRELEKGAGAEALLRAARADGFKSLREHGLALARAGTTTLHEVLANTGGS